MFLVRLLREGLVQRRAAQPALRPGHRPAGRTQGLAARRDRPVTPGGPDPRPRGEPPLEGHGPGPRSRTTYMAGGAGDLDARRLGVKVQDDGIARRLPDVRSRYVVDRECHGAEGDPIFHRLQAGDEPPRLSGVHSRCSYARPRAGSCAILALTPQDPMDTWYTVRKWYSKTVRILIFQRLSPR